MTQEYKKIITDDITIKGHYNLILKCGNKYNIGYCIHQGGRGYCCYDYRYFIWISYDCVDKNFKD